MADAAADFEFSHLHGREPKCERPDLSLRGQVSKLDASARRGFDHAAKGQRVLENHARVGPENTRAEACREERELDTFDAVIAPGGTSLGVSLPNAARKAGAYCAPIASRADQ